MGPKRSTRPPGAIHLQMELCGGPEGFRPRSLLGTPPSQEPASPKEPGHPNKALHHLAQAPNASFQNSGALIDIRNTRALEIRPPTTRTPNFQKQPCNSYGHINSKPALYQPRTPSKEPFKSLLKGPLSIGTARSESISISTSISILLASVSPSKEL